MEAISTVTLGATSELIAAADLMSKGYSVFRNMSPNGHCDLIIAKKYEPPQKVEVRTGKIVKWRGHKQECLIWLRKKGEPEFVDMYAVVVPGGKVYYIISKIKQGKWLEYYETLQSDDVQQGLCRQAKVINEGGGKSLLRDSTKHQFKLSP